MDEPAARAGLRVNFQQQGVLAAIAQASDDAIFAKDLDGRYRFANPALLAAFAKSEAEVIGRTDAELIEDADAARRIAQHDKMVHAGKAREFEEPVLLRNGAVRHWHSLKAPLADESGRVVGLVGISRDVTVRKEAEARADADRMKLQMAMQAAGLVTAEIDYRTDLNHISAELARMMELGDEEMIVPRQVIFDRIHPDDRERYLEAIRRTVDPEGNGHLSIKVRTLARSGTVRWLHIVLQVTFSMVDGELKPDRGICAAADVTAEMLAERKALAAQRMTEAVIENAGALVYAKDLQGRFMLSNQAWRKLHDLTQEEAAQVTSVHLFGAEVAAQLLENDRRVIETGEQIVALERAVVHGRTATFRSHKFPLYDEAGQVFAVCGVSTDITDVVEADRRKDEFIATLAHELRNPLAPIRNGLEILKRIPDLPQQAGKVRDMMDRQLAHLVRLVDDLLDVSRITRDKLEMRVEPITLQEIVDDAIEASRPGMDSAQHQLVVDLPMRPVHIEGDLTRLAQVVSNLLNNAAKYTATGGRIEIAAHTDGGQVVMEVRDNGAGIPAETLPHVFDLFAQGGMKKHAQGGLGIGLWLVKKLVQLHRGTIEAKSDGPGRGSTFTLRLPIAQQ
ncbi:MAG TPA: PAS domain-containing protein [Ramlibacter sp.]|nr:PAS domain-containing protein [Ramlibacter sp.]